MAGESAEVPWNNDQLFRRLTVWSRCLLLPNYMRGPIQYTRQFIKTWSSTTPLLCKCPTPHSCLPPEPQIPFCCSHLTLGFQEVPILGCLEGSLYRLSIIQNLPRQCFIWTATRCIENEISPLLPESIFFSTLLNFPLERSRDFSNLSAH